jgi:hypothetical protein
MQMTHVEVNDESRQCSFCSMHYCEEPPNVLGGKGANRPDGDGGCVPVNGNGNGEFGDHNNMSSARHGRASVITLKQDSGSILRQPTFL